MLLQMIYNCNEHSLNLPFSYLIHSQKTFKYCVKNTTKQTHVLFGHKQSIYYNTKATKFLQFDPIILKQKNTNLQKKTVQIVAQS